MKIPTHMEAGNRSFDRNVPEETNRRVVDHTADFNLVYTEHARRHLLSEGIHHRRIYLTGSPMREVLEYYRPRINASDVLKRLGLKRGGYFIVSLHREENVDNAQRLSEFISALNLLGKTYDKPIIISTHPRTRKRLDALGSCKLHPHVKWMAPLVSTTIMVSNGCLQYFDSGTIVEESSILDFPAITPRDAIELQKVWM